MSNPETLIPDQRLQGKNVYVTSKSRSFWRLSYQADTFLTRGLSPFYSCLKVLLSIGRVNNICLAYSCALSLSLFFYTHTHKTHNLEQTTKNSAEVWESGRINIRQTQKIGRFRQGERGEDTTQHWNMSRHIWIFHINILYLYDMSSSIRNQVTGT